MIRKILEFLDNKKELEEMQKEYSQMKEVLTFNLKRTDKFIKDVQTALECNEYNKHFDNKVKIRKVLELCNDFNSTN